ncbi:uncharacterized protein B0I36DRAFT_347129 [Microdochium trichocladiopsis]|uniref:Basic proline-rich protein n=1 Tax=Microdochium trichocladiopsis TaxID=1682393 RepID=A0A9P8YBH7_9PEZI|nr:uncharacterized protein B0I36DRAFT_347129 [Microdochium trichocladiopsis]KAH7035331.1 hypothetical protein B0I36DRAFT_347129 [Microdochium trichocladiopsis]
MEPVPETESLEEFRSSPLPTMRFHHSPTTPIITHDSDLARKPLNVRRSTEPLSPTSPWSTTALPYRPRTTSPLSGSHTRSKSTASLQLPSMNRTRSLPGLDGAGRIVYPPLIRPSSPSGSPSRQRVPRKPTDEAFPSSPVRTSVLDTDQRHPDRSSSPVHGAPPSSALRNASPLRYTVTSSGGPSLPGTPSSLATSPSYRPDSSLGSYSFPSYSHSSSVPSTPSSMRSRSPSISSLETIPDTPDAEEAALEAERIAQLKAAADAAEGEDGKGRGNLDVPTRGRTLGVGSRDKRKRWSVCGAERRGDLDLETIWED